MLSNELDYQCLLRIKSAVVNLITVWLDSKTKLITSKQGQALCVLTVVVVVVVGSRYKGHFYWLYRKREDNNIFIKIKCST